MGRTGSSARCWRGRRNAHLSEIRRARTGDALPIARVHVAAWRSAYAGILPAHALTGLSVSRQAAQYEADIGAGRGVFVVVNAGLVVGFATAGPPRRKGIAEGEIDTLYVLDDWREQGLGRLLLRKTAVHLAAAGARSVFLWVLRDNPSRWFYERLGGRAALTSMTGVGGVEVAQVAYVWDPVDTLVA